MRMVQENVCVPNGLFKKYVHLNDDLKIGKDKYRAIFQDKKSVTLTVDHPKLVKTILNDEKMGTKSELIYHDQRAEPDFS